jgi:hypothetical protein
MAVTFYGLDHDVEDTIDLMNVQPSDKPATPSQAFEYSAPQSKIRDIFDFCLGQPKLTSIESRQVCKETAQRAGSAVWQNGCHR